MSWLDRYFGNTVNNYTGSIGGGTASAWSGTFATASACYWLDLTSSDVTINLDTVPAFASGLAYQFDSQGTHTVTFTSSLGIIGQGSGGSYVSSFPIQPMGSSIIVKANAANKWGIE